PFSAEWDVQVDAERRSGGRRPLQGGVRLGGPIGGPERVGWIVRNEVVARSGVVIVLKLDSLRRHSHGRMSVLFLLRGVFAGRITNTNQLPALFPALIAVLVYSISHEHGKAS